MTAVRYTGVYDDPDGGREAHYVIDDYGALAALLGR
jgi:hypothetical protein